MTKYDNNTNISSVDYELALIWRRRSLRHRGWWWWLCIRCKQEAQLPQR